jgi:translation initiation factor 3 subunit E
LNLFSRNDFIDFSMLAEKLNMGAEEAERWIVNLIRNASLDAKIDSQKGNVVMGSQALSPYQTIIEKTKNLFNRTQMLAQNSERKRDTNVNKIFLKFFVFLRFVF